jgi:hypothetical protein
MGVVARQGQPKHHTKIGEMLETMFSVRFSPRLYTEHEESLGPHYITMWFCSQRRISNPLMGSLFQIISFIGLTTSWGRAIAQAVSRWFPTAATWVRSRVWSSGICGGQSGARQDLSEYFGFPCQSWFHQLLHNHPHLSSGAGTIGQKWPQYKGHSPTPLAIKKRLITQDLERFQCW